jgi:hypothetical protein
MNKSELDKSIYDREQFQKKVNDSIEVCESEKNNLANSNTKLLFFEIVLYHIYFYLILIYSL